MHLHLRINVDCVQDAYAGDEALLLRDFIICGPGVQAMQIEKHVRGGHAVTLECKGKNCDELISYVSNLSAIGCRLIECTKSPT